MGCATVFVSVKDKKIVECIFKEYRIRKLGALLREYIYFPLVCNRPTTIFFSKIQWEDVKKGKCYAKVHR